MIPRWKPNLAPFFYAYKVYVMRDSEPAELLSPVPLRVAAWVDTTPPHGRRSRRRSCRQRIWNLCVPSP